MVNFYNYVPTGSHTVYPDIDPLYLSSTSGSLRILLVQDLDNSETEIFPTLTSTPNAFTPRINFTVPSGSLPHPRGQYTMYTYEGIYASDIWNLISSQWQTIASDWNEALIVNERLISTDRAWVEGVNGVTITQYTGTNQTGTYTTYNY